MQHQHLPLDARTHQQHEQHRHDEVHHHEHGEVNHHHHHQQHQVLPQHLQHLADPHDLPQEALQQPLPVASAEYGHDGEGEEEHVHGQYLLHKRLMDDVLAQSSGLIGVPMPSDLSGPDKKRRKTTTEQQVKRHKYDVLKAFFRVYFTEAKDAMVLKDAIYNLYVKKIPISQGIARNAMYRHMWSFFKNRISAFQSNYREYIKGIKLSTNGSNLTYDGYEKDLDLLHTIGVDGVFDFDEEELEKVDFLMPGVSSPYLTGEGESGTNSSALESSIVADGSILAALEQLEQQVLLVAAGFAELLARIKKGETEAEGSSV